MKETKTATATATGKDFPLLPFERQVSFVSACLTDVAKMIDEQASITEVKPGEKPHSFHSAMAFRFDEERRNDIEQEAFCLCLERANNPKYCDLPQALFVAKACGSAFSKAFYNQTKIIITEKEIQAFYGETSSPETVISGKAPEKIFPAPEAEILKEEFKNRIIAKVSEKIRERASRMIDGLESGLLVTEIAKRESISPKRALEIYQIILNSTACVLAEDGEDYKVEKAIESHRTINRNLSRRIESAREYATVKGFYDKAKAKAETESELKPLSYIDRIVWAGKNQSELRNLFRK